MDFQHLLNDSRRCIHESYAPPGHAITFGKTASANDPILQLRYRHEAEMSELVIDQEIISLVADNEEVMLQHDFCHRSQFALRKNGAGRVDRTAQNYRFRLFSNRFANAFDVELPAA